MIDETVDTYANSRGKSDDTVTQHISACMNYDSCVMFNKVSPARCVLSRSEKGDEQLFDEGICKDPYFLAILNH